MTYLSDMIADDTHALDKIIAESGKGPNSLAAYISQVRHTVALAHEIPDGDVLESIHEIARGYDQGVSVRAMAEGMGARR